MLADMKLPSFKRKPKSLPEQRDNRVRLAAQIAQAEADLAVVRERALEADIDSINAPELVAVRDTEFYLTVLQNKLIRLDAEIAERTAAEAAAEIQKVRDATSRKLNAFADDLEKKTEPFRAAILAVKVSIDEFKDFLPHGAGTYQEFLTNLLREGPAICQDFVERLRRRADETAKGNAPPTLPALFIPAIIEHAPPLVQAHPDNLKIFALRDIEWLVNPGSKGQPPWPAVRINDLMAEPVFHSKFQPSPSLSPEFGVKTRANEPKRTVWIERGPEPGDDEQF